MRVVALGLLLVLAIVSAADAGKTKLKKPKRGIQMRTSPYTVGPGEDREWCEYRRLPIKKPMDVIGFEVRMPPGAHHFVVWGYGGTEQDDSKFPAGPVESVGCAGLGPGEIVPPVIMPLQSPNVRFKLPKGLAFRLEPGQQVWLNPHYRNPGTEAVTPDVRFNLHAAKPGKVEHYVHGLIIGNMAGINIPANGTQTITAEWTAPVNMNFALLTTHQHRLGTYANIELFDETNTTKTVIYENYEWEHPDNLWPQPALRMVKGQKIRITCTWDNTDPVPIRFGPNTTDEMCFILGFFYRDKGDTEPFVSPTCLPSNSGILCPMAPLVTD
jgi:hypothetical protein